MAKKFVGFKPETLQNKILPALGYDGPMDQASINKFLAANPAAAAKMGRYTLAARKTIEGQPTRGFAVGGDVDWAAWHEFSGGAMPSSDPAKFFAFQAMQNAASAPASTPATTPAATPATGKNEGTAIGSAQTMTKAITSDPRKLTIQADVAQTDPTAMAAGMVGTNAGTAGPASLATTYQAPGATPAQAAPTTAAAQIQAAQATPAMNAMLDQQQAAQGQVSQQAEMQAAQGDPNQLAQLNLQAAQGQAATVQGAPAPIQMTPGQTVSGSTVNQAQVNQALAQTQAASVQDEMASLMQQFQGGQTPAWAAGAMRNATAVMAARGLSASSMAGQAVVQAAMESALPIAQIDASNKQQMALFKAEQRAKFIGQEFDQNFQAKVINAARISEIANINFTAEQQVALENAKMAQTMNLANLDNRQAKVMADAATMAQMDLTNLNNRQQAQVQNAQAFLQMDMTNLSNEQQMSMFKAQERANTMLNDVAAQNAAKQFNATSQNQTDQFFSSLATQVSQFNTEQSNAMQRFNAGEANALQQFNAAQENAREQFNTQNHLIIAQANAQWAQSITTAENAAQNQANRDAVLAANNLTMTAYNNIVQRERDTLAWAWQSGENAAQRDANIAVAKINAEASASAAGDTSAAGLSAASGQFLGQIAINAANLLFNK